MAGEYSIRQTPAPHCGCGNRGLFALVIPYTAEICVLFAAIAGVAKEAFDQYRYKGWDWLDLAYTMAGGFIIQIFAWL